MWGGFDNLGIGACLFGNLAHNTDEVIQRFASFRFRWLDHEGLVHDQWKVDGWRIHTEVEDTLGDVERCDTIFFFLMFGGGNELMLAHLWICDLIIGG